MLTNLLVIAVGLAVQGLSGCGSRMMYERYPGPKPSGSGLLDIDRVHFKEPKGKHERTLIYMQGMGANAPDQWKMVEEKGLMKGLETSGVRIVIPQVKKTSKNKEKLWFPFLIKPWSVSTTSIGTMSEVNWSLRMLLPIIDSEAKKLNGDFSKIYIFGYSQGGMMAIWSARISDRPLGGVLVYAGCLPVLEADHVSKLGQSVPIVHLHDPRDLGVLYAHGQRGYELANKIGAHGYRPIVNFEVNGDSHHGLSAGSLAVANKYLTDMMTR